jgi:hypothetical protein
VIVAGAAASVFVLALASVALRSTPSLEVGWPRAAVAKIDRVLERDPHARVFASAEYGDWLLYNSPAVKGRLAFNGHFELLEPKQLRALARYFDESGTQWQSAARGYRVLVLNPRTEGRLIADVRGERNVRVLYASPYVIVLDRSPRPVSRIATPGS